MARDDPPKTSEPVDPRLSSIESEVAMLSILMNDNRRVDRVVEILKGEDFAEPVYGRIYDRIVQLVSAGAQANPITLPPYFTDDERFAEVGGAGLLMNLTGNTSSGFLLIRAADQAKIIADLAARRRAVAGLEAAIEAARDRDVTMAQVVDQADAALVQASGKQGAGKGLGVHAAFTRTMKQIEDEAAGKVPPGLAVAGFDDWNELTGNMRRGEVIIVAGRPSMGKTAIGISTALASARAGWGTLFITLEMSIDELMKRAIADLIFEYGHSASARSVAQGKFSHFDRMRLDDVEAQLKEWPLKIHEDAGLSISRLAMIVRRYKRQFEAEGKSLDVLFIDYLGLMRGENHKQNRREEIGLISRTIKEIARELDIAVVVLAQLNRGPEQREDKRPQLSDLRESGDIEQDADTVIMLYREQYYLERSEPEPTDKKREAWELALTASRDRVELLAMKARRGAVSKRRSYFYTEHQAVRSSGSMASGRGM